MHGCLKGRNIKVGISEEQVDDPRDVDNRELEESPLTNFIGAQLAHPQYKLSI